MKNLRSIRARHGNPHDVFGQGLVCLIWQKAIR